MTEPTSTPTSADLSVVFIEPKTTVAGLTGTQWSLFRQYEEERRCDFEDELYNRCPDDKASWSPFCEFHTPEAYYDEYDIWRDNPYEE